MSEDSEQQLMDEMKEKYGAEVISIEEDEKLNINTIIFQTGEREMTARGYSRTDALYAALTWLAATSPKNE